MKWFDLRNKKASAQSTHFKNFSQHSLISTQDLYIYEVNMYN